jgi:hypothetical protein
MPPQCATRPSRAAWLLPAHGTAPLSIATRGATATVYNRSEHGAVAAPQRSLQLYLW